MEKYVIFIRYFFERFQRMNGTIYKRIWKTEITVESFETEDNFEDT